jgi:very-short-patch-repair endonuclease
MAFQADRTTTNVLQLVGYTVLRFTWADLTRRPEMVARQIRTALRRTWATGRRRAVVAEACTLPAGARVPA